MNANAEACQQHSIGSTSSGVAIEWDHNLEAGSVDRALFIFTELATGNQTRHEVVPKFHDCIPLVAGTYRVAVFAKGLESYRSTLELRPGSASPFKPVLNPKVEAAKTLKDVLAKFDLNQIVNTRDLEVPKNSTVVLDMHDKRYNADWRNVEIKDVQTAKRIIGHSDELWGGNVQRFKSLSVSTQGSPEEIAGQAVREYVYGNAATVKQWTKQINEAVFSEPWLFPLFTLGTVTVNAGGVLVIGDKANFFVCERLRMHVTATLLIRGSGPIHVEPLVFETFC